MMHSKFRVWTGVKYEYDVMIGRFGVFYVNPGTKGDGRDPLDSASLSSWNTEIEDAIVELFTGLYDSTKWTDLKEDERKSWTAHGNMPSEWKGREIYEGDIVQSCAILDSTKICVNEVKFIDCCFIANGLMSEYQNYKVIGNIHENKELVERKKA